MPQFMRGTWDNVLRDNAGKDMYDVENNANVVAGYMGAKQVNVSDNWCEQLFPDGSTTWVMVDGSGTTNALP
jgi:hypothetical protein